MSKATKNPIKPEFIEFRLHQLVCARCASEIDPTKTSTFNLGCAAGGRMISEEATSVKRERVPRPDNWCSKEKLKKLMVYKKEEEQS